MCCSASTHRPEKVLVYYHHRSLVAIVLTSDSPRDFVTFWQRKPDYSEDYGQFITDFKLYTTVQRGRLLQGFKQTNKPTLVVVLYTLIYQPLTDTFSNSPATQ